jgi:signal transduction histidine kinase
LTNARILNVDDHDAGRYARTRFLSRAGFSVDEAATGEEALSMVRDRRPDLVLLDINLPDIDGFEICRRIKSDPDTSRLPVIFLSASRLADMDVVEGLEHGGDNYLREPIDPSVLVAMVRSVLRAKSAEDALVRSNEQLRRFAFVVSHELQEPLRMVKSYTQLLAQRYKDAVGEQAHEFVHYTVSGVDRMEKFIHDMLSYSQAAESAFEMKPFPSRTALDWALLELQPAIQESAASITFDELPLVFGDPMRLSQVFKNLIGNAIKYRSAEEPVINISCTEQGSEYTFCVCDNGIGIDPQYFTNVFTLFRRLHGRELSGSGVGLAICKEIVEHHGGRIWVESKPGAGSQFCFTLPKVSSERVASTGK